MKKRNRIKVKYEKVAHCEGNFLCLFLFEKDYHKRVLKAIEQRQSGSKVFAA